MPSANQGCETMSEGITQFFLSKTKRHGNSLWRSGVAAGIGLILWMQSNFPSRKELERVERKLDRIEDKLEALQAAVANHSGILGKRYE